MKEIYFELKQVHRTQSTDITLGDICSFVCEDERKEQYCRIPIHLEQIVTTIDAFTVVEMLKQYAHDEGLIQPVGNTKCTVERHEKQRVTAGTIVKVIIASLILLFGGAVSIMNFHADVNMREVHTQIYEFATGIRQDSVPWVSIPYAVGVFFGFLFALNIFSRKKNREPNAVELSVHEYQKKIKNYIDEKEDENGQ